MSAYYQKIIKYLSACILMLTLAVCVIHTDMDALTAFDHTVSGSGIITTGHITFEDMNAEESAPSALVKPVTVRNGNSEWTRNLRSSIQALTVFVSLLLICLGVERFYDDGTHSTVSHRYIITYIHNLDGLKK
ncbi:MAG: hypothetical protein IJ058_12625 [Lachnospiraceae bacterium]|nr:hypothetical protein [Lachnospiraceae bacterium]